MVPAAFLFPLAASAAAAFNPSPVLRFDATPAEIAEDCEKARNRAEMRLTQISGIGAQARSFENTFEAFDDALAQLADETASAILLKSVAVSSATRDAGGDCKTMVARFFVDVFTREDLFKAFTDYEKRGERLGVEERRELSRTLLEFERNGLALPLEKREQLKSINKRLADVRNEFLTNIDESTVTLSFSRAELEGLPDEYLSRLRRNGELYRVSLDSPDYWPFMSNVQSGEARRRLYVAGADQAAARNLPLLREGLSLRHEAARLLGYRNHAQFVLEKRMARSPEAVDSFLRGLGKRLTPLARAELAAMRPLKAAIESRSAGRLEPWDLPFYETLQLKARFEVDREAIKEYFPLERVLDGAFQTFERIFGLKFRPVEDALVWHKDVRLYEVKDAQTNELVGYFYLDLFPREGKVKHGGTALEVLRGRRDHDGKPRVTVAALLTNFDPPAPGRPALLRFSEDVDETLFHELGHILHELLSRPRFARAWTADFVSWDFVEAPSQMLQDFSWRPEIVAEISGHYKDPARKLPAGLFARMLRTRTLNAGISNLRQIALSKADMAFHTRPPSDTTSAWRRIFEETVPLKLPPGIHPEASFGHIFDDYDAGYYGYLWSQVFAEDMFSVFETEGVLSPSVGRRFRELILEQSAARDEAEQLRAFLGREPSEDAFLRRLGLEPKTR